MAGLGKAKSEFKSDKFNFEVDVVFHLSAIHEYIEYTKDFVETKIINKIDKYKEEIENDFESIDMNDYLITLNNKEFYYNSIFISLYSFLEKKMYQLCKIAESQHTIKIKDQRGRGIKQYKEYLKNVVKINFEELKSEWDNICNLGELRNLIMHNTTEVHQNDSKLINKLKSINKLSFRKVDENFEFYIDDIKLLTEFSNTINKFLETIYDE